MSRKNKGLVALIASAVCFGFVPMFMKAVCAEGGNTLSGAFYRFFLSLLPLYIYLKCKKTPLAISGNEFLHVCIVTIFGYGGTSLLLFFSYNFIPSGLATTIHFAYPAIVIFASTVFLREKAVPGKIVCALVCIAGMSLFYDGEASASLPGIALAFASGCTYAFYTIYLSKSCLRDMPSIKLIFYMNSVATVLIFVTSVLAGEFTVGLSAYGWAAACVFAVSVSFIGVLGYQLGIKYTGPQNAAILSTFEPITSMLVGIILYNESFTIKTALGCVFILAATVIVAFIKED